MRSLIALHETEGGFDSTKELSNWIGRQANPEQWRVVEILADSVTEHITNKQHEEELERAYVRGKEAQKEIFRNKLGL